MIKPFFSIVLASYAATSFAASTTSATDPFSLDRMKAASNLSTAIVTSQKMLSGCEGQGDLTTKTQQESINNWQTRNKPYLVTHFQFMNGYLAAVEKAQGEAAAKNKLTEITKFNNDQANEIIKKMIEKDGTVVACKKYFGTIASGSMDIKEGYPDFKIWKGMLEYSKKSTSAKK